MNISTKSKLLLLIFSLLFVLALGIGTFAKYSVENTMLTSQGENSINSVALAQLNILDRFQILFTNKTNEAIALQENVRTLLSILEEIGSKEENLLDFLSNFPLPKNMVLIALDNQNNALYLDNSYRFIEGFYEKSDIKNRPLAETMRRITLTKQFAAAVMQVEDVETGAELRFFGAHIYFSQDDILVGIWVDIASLETEHNLLLEKTIGELQSNLSKIALGKTGFIFVVDANGKGVIGPDNDFINKEMQANNQYLFNEIKAKAHTDKFFEGQIYGRDAIFFLEYAKPFHWYIVGTAFIDEIKAPGQALSYTLIVGMLLAMFLILILAFMFIRRLTAPIEALANYARKLPDEDFMAEAKPNALLLNLISQNEKDEINKLAQSFVFMDSTLRKKLQELMELSVSRERIESELQVAKEIQMGFLPKEIDFIKYPLATKLFQLKARLVPAREVGGDLYDFFLFDSHFLYFAIGDVSDKGVPASLFMSMTMTLIHSNANQTSCPKTIMENLNTNLVRENPKCMFVTLIIGKLDLRTGEILYVNAGHNPPVILSEGKAIWLEGISGPVVGIIENMEYSLLKYTLKPNDILFLYTDGINEAMNAKKEMYSNESMIKILTEFAHTDVHTLLDAVQADVTKHVQGTLASDDLTMLAIQYTPDNKELL